MASLVYKEDKRGSLIFEKPFRHIKFIKLEMLDNINFNKETFEITFSYPKTEILIDFINWKNQITIIVLEKDLITSDIVLVNRIINETGPEPQTEPETQPETQTEPETQKEKSAEKFNEKLGLFKKLFTKQGPVQEGGILKIENNQKINETNLTWLIHKK